MTVFIGSSIFKILQKQEKLENTTNLDSSVNIKFLIDKIRNSFKNLHMYILQIMIF